VRIYLGQPFSEGFAHKSDLDVLVVSKRQMSREQSAADWALERLDEEHRAVLARARAIYVGEAEDRWDDLGPRVRREVEYIVARVNRLAG